MPVITQYEGTFKNIRIIPFPKYTRELADSHGVNLTYDYFLDVINKTVDGKYLQNVGLSMMCYKIHKKISPSSQKAFI